jgi:RNA recognition motif-containing protein
MMNNMGLRPMAPIEKTPPKETFARESRLPGHSGRGTLGMRSRGKIMNIYVGNLPYTVSEDDLRAAFAEFGEVTSANVIMDRMSGQSKGFGFVEMPNDSEAEEAINALNESAFNGRNIKVNQARPRNERSGGGGRSRY